MSNKILDNGTILTLGLVGTVAAIGAAAQRGVYGSRSTSSAPSVGEYDDFVVATKSKGNKHAYYIEGHDGDLDDGWYYNSITWGVDLVGPYDSAADALRNA